MTPVSPSPHDDAAPGTPGGPGTPGPGGGRTGARFLTLADVAEILATSVAQVRALVHAGELRYIQIGGRQQYRIEDVELEKYIARMYARTDAQLSAPPTSPGQAHVPSQAPSGQDGSDAPHR